MTSSDQARALQERTSVSEIVRRLLSSYFGAAVEQPATVDATKITEVLVRYSNGEIRRGEAMRAVVGREHCLFAEICLIGPMVGRASRHFPWLHRLAIFPAEPRPSRPNVRKTLIDQADRDEVGVDTSWTPGKKP
jgi:hypothetical protein